MNRLAGRSCRGRVLYHKAKAEAKKEGKTDEEATALAKLVSRSDSVGFAGCGRESKRESERQRERESERERETERVRGDRDTETQRHRERESGKEQKVRMTPGLHKINT